jgi:hypothetical protein
LRPSQLPYVRIFTNTCQCTKPLPEKQTPAWPVPFARRISRAHEIMPSARASSRPIKHSLR